MPDNEDDVAYALETGYYPQIANKVYSKRHLGTKHGSTGEKYARVQGWGASSIEKAKFARCKFIKSRTYKKYRIMTPVGCRGDIRDFNSRKKKKKADKKVFQIF